MISDKQRHEQISIALADDYAMVRNFLINTINALPGCKVVLAAADGAELIREIEKLLVLPDVCILDISMPRMSGYDTQIAIKRRWPEMKSLALSIYDDMECITEMFKNGAQGFILKDSSEDIIYEAILTVCNGGYYYKQLPGWSSTQTKRLPQLTEREKEYLTLLCSGLNMEKIAQHMDINIRTVEHYRDNVYKKVNVNNKADLLFYVMRTSIVYHLPLSSVRPHRYYTHIAGLRSAVMGICRRL